MGSSGLEPPTSRLSGARSNHLSYEPISIIGVSSLHLFASGGDDGIRTHDPLLAEQVLSQLSYTPICLPAFRFVSFLRQSFKIEQQEISFSKTSSISLSILWVLFSSNIRSYLLKLLSSELPAVLHRKEVIQPHLPIRLPCYDFTPVANPTFGSALLAVELLTSGITGSHGVTGGVYKARERIHRGMLIRDY